MTIFRLLLYLTCAFSISWSAVVFLGPAVITRIVASYTNGAVELSKVKLSPMLDLSIGRLDFEIYGVNPISGFSRSTEIKWSFMSDQPFLIFDIGPTVIKEILSVKNTKVSTGSFGSIDWDSLPLALDANGLNTQMFGSADDLSFSGNLNRDLKKVSDISFNAKTVSLRNIKPTLSAQMITGKVDQFDLTKTLGFQVLSGSLTTGSLVGANPDFTGSDIEGRFKLSPAGKNLSIDLFNVGLSDFDGSINKVKFVGDFDSEFGLQNINLNLSDGIFNDNAPSFSNISTEIMKSINHSYNISLEGDLGEYELYQVDNYLGLVPPSNLKIDMKLDAKNLNLNGVSKVIFDSAAGANISAAAKAKLKFNQFDDIKECFALNCKIKDFNIDYQISLDQEWVKGRSNCSENPCGFNLINHSLTTSDTVNIFSILNRSGILNPLSSLYFFTAVTSGQKVKEGHHLKF